MTSYQLWCCVQSRNLPWPRQTTSCGTVWSQPWIPEKYQVLDFNTRVSDWSEWCLGTPCESNHWHMHIHRAYKHWVKIMLQHKKAYMHASVHVCRILLCIIGKNYGAECGAYCFKLILMYCWIFIRLLTVVIALNDRIVKVFRRADTQNRHAHKVYYGGNCHKWLQLNV